MKLPDFTDAACSGVGTEMFFPDNRELEASTHRAIIKLCASCPIYKVCLDYALNVKVEGFWAGTTLAERSVMRRRLGIKGINLTTQYISDAMVSPNAKAKRKQRLARLERKEQANV